MRALLTTHALAASDWEVRFACIPSFCHSVRATGFDASPMGSDWSSRDLTETFPEFRDVPLDARNRWVNERLWSDLLPRGYYPDLVELVRDLAPDVIVSGRAELAGPTIGEELGVPWVVTSAGRVIGIRQFLSEGEGLTADTIARATGSLHRLRTRGGHAACSGRHSQTARPRGRRGRHHQVAKREEYIS